jgi:hypothetical protein
MFINFWYPAIESAKLTDQPVKVQMLGCEFVLFRDAAGEAHCLANTCVHRGGSLGDGRVLGRMASAVKDPDLGTRRYIAIATSHSSGRGLSPSSARGLTTEGIGR